MTFKFRRRTKTDSICVVCKNLRGASKDKLFRNARRLGELDTNYHFVMSSCGLEEPDRDIKAVAGSSLPNYESNIFVLVDALDKDHLNDAQKLALNRMSIRFDLPINYIEE